MVNTELIVIIASIILGCGFTYYLFIPKEKRGLHLDQWLGLAFAFIIGYKLLPILFTPGIVLKPIQLLLLRSGDLGILLGFVFALVYWIVANMKRIATIREQYVYVLTALITCYTVYSILDFEIYAGHYLGLYRFLLGVAFLVGIKIKTDVFRMLLLLYGGLLLVIQSQAYAHWYGPFSLIQWLILALLVIYFLVSITYREEGTEWQEK